jgi:hypothetical protein
MTVGSVSGTACTARGSTVCTGSALRLWPGGEGGTGGGNGAGSSAACGCAASGAAAGGAGDAGSAAGSSVDAACGIAADGTGGADSRSRSRIGVPMIPAASTEPQINKIPFCMRATVASARRLSQCSRAQPVSEDMTREMKPSIADGSIQRSTATMPVVGSIQVELPPAPLAKMLSGEALAYRRRPALSHHK